MSLHFSINLDSQVDWFYFSVCQEICDIKDIQIYSLSSLLCVLPFLYLHVLFLAWKQSIINVRNIFLYKKQSVCKCTHVKNSWQMC